LPGCRTAVRTAPGVGSAPIGTQARRCTGVVGAFAGIPSNHVVEHGIGRLALQQRVLAIELLHPHRGITPRNVGANPIDRQGPGSDWTAQKLAARSYMSLPELFSRKQSQTMPTLTWPVP
jgi:hypothetical protein